jgi:iron complex transport system permease protein
MVLLPAILAAVVLAGLSFGAVPLPSGVVLGFLAQALELPIPTELTKAQAAVLLHIRLPRVILGMLVGGSLAVAGAVMQALFRNPLADPAIIGVSSGAALATVVVIVLGDTVLQGLHDLLGIWTLPVAAFLGGLGVTALVYRLSWQQGETRMASLLLGGIAINSLTGAATGLLIYMADDAQLRTLTFWAMGSLGGAN